jgi:hypothetical protein
LSTPRRSKRQSAPRRDAHCSGTGHNGMPELPDQVFHIADALNWEAIQREGLLSTSALINRAGVDDTP